MNSSRLSDEMLSVVWSPEKHDPEWKNEYLLKLQERCKDSGNSIGEWLCGQRSLRNFPAVAGAECNTVIELKLEHHAA
jgi:hypothetical protein